MENTVWSCLQGIKDTIILLEADQKKLDAGVKSAAPRVRKSAQIIKGFVQDIRVIAQEQVKKLT